MTGITRPISSAASTGAWPGRVDSPPMSSRSAPVVDHPACQLHGRRDRVGIAEQAVARERIGRDVEDAHHERPFAPGERRRTDAGGRASGERGGVVGAFGVMPGPGRAGLGRRRGAPGRRRQDRATRPRPSARAADAHARAPRAGRVRRSPASVPPPARASAPRAPRPASRAARRRSSRSRSRPAGRSPRHAPSMIPSTSLSAMDADDQRQRPGREVWAQVVEGLGQGGSARRVVRPVEEDLVAVHGQQLEAAGPRRVRIPARAGSRRRRVRSRRRPARRAARRRRRRSRPGAGRAARPASARGRGSSTVRPSRSQPSSGAGHDLGERHAHPCAPGGG